jgi:ribosome biogenesis GTPase / thiamine phosphate phosphatase
LRKDGGHEYERAPLGVTVTGSSDSARTNSLPDLGWSDFFEDQRQPDDLAFVPCRIASVHRSRLTAISPAGPIRLTLPVHGNTGDFAVGDWVLVDSQTHVLHRRLSRRTVLERHTEGAKAPQLAAANVDTLFIVTSCNADFNPARLERYLALANQGGANPVILLTKVDATDDANSYQQQAATLQRDLAVVTLSPHSRDAATALAPWCGIGQTVAMVGSSGVGKSTLVNILAGTTQAPPQLTQEIRENDAKGRHTTTSRSIHAIAGGGWVIDTPGMRTLHISNAAHGVSTLFAEITELAPLCRFRDCTHDHEPGCAVQAAVVDGKLEPARLARWRKLVDENDNNTPNKTAPQGGGGAAARSRKR